MNFHAPVRSFSTELAYHYAAVRARLGGLPAVASAPVLLLPAPAWIEPHIVSDIVPDQRGREIVPAGADVEIVAARRALMIFARLRQDNPGLNSVRHLQLAVAAAFKVDLARILERTRRPGPTRVRQIAMMLAMRVCKLPRNQVAIRFDRNHSTVMHAERKLAAFLDGATSDVGNSYGW